MYPLSHFFCFFKLIYSFNLIFPFRTSVWFIATALSLWRLFSIIRISFNYRFTKTRGVARISKALAFAVEPTRRSLASLLCQGFASIPSR